MTEATSWVEAAPFGETGYAVRCIECEGGWYRDSHRNIITRTDRGIAEKVRARHDRFEHSSTTLLLSQLGAWGGGR